MYLVHENDKQSATVPAFLAKHQLLSPLVNLTLIYNSKAKSVTVQSNLSK